MKTVKIFYSYAQEDEAFRQHLEKHLIGLRHSMLITTWHDRQIRAGMHWEQEIDVHLETADIVLPLVTSDFLRSGYCNGAEMKRALERHNTGEAYVIPILLKPVDLGETLLKDIAILPTGSKPVTEWEDVDEAFTDIAEGIERVVTNINILALAQNTASPVRSIQQESFVSVPETDVYSNYRHSSIKEIAVWLITRKRNNHDTVLLLGSRSGELFRSAHFYDHLQKLSTRNFHQLSRIKQFQECYAILSSNKFSERDLHTILQASLKDISTIEADISLATLIKDGYFHEIITTNIDDGLENAMLMADMKEGRNYEVTRYTHRLVRMENNLPYRVTKVFGDLVSRDYIVERASYLDKNQSLKAFLQRMLSRDVLLVGIDPVWDRDILRIIPATANGSIWLVSEEKDIVNKSPDLADLLYKRSSACVLGHEGSYDSFVPKLHEYLNENGSPNYPPAHSQTLQNIQNQIDRVVDLLPDIEVQIKNLTALLHGTYDKLQALQNENQTMLSEIQKIKNNEEIEKKQLRENH